MAEVKKERLLRLREVLHRTGLKETKLRELMKAGEFPKPIKLSDDGRAVAWLESEVEAWIAHRIAKAEVA